MILRLALRQMLISRLRVAFDEQSVGTLNLGAHYVQWAGHPGGLQVECRVDRAGRLRDVQNARLLTLGYAEPDEQVPNHYARFVEPVDVAAAADLLVETIEDVLDDAELALPMASIGFVTVVLPVGKCFRERVEQVVRPLLDATRTRRLTTLVDLSGGESLGDEPLVGPDVLDVDPHSLRDIPPVLLGSAPFSKLDQLRWATDVAEVCVELRARGAHVIVIAPMYVPPESSVFNAVIPAVADSVLAVADVHGAHLLRDDIVSLFRSQIPHRVLADYGETDWELGADVIEMLDCTGRFRLPDDCQRQPLVRELALAGGLFELA